MKKENTQTHNIKHIDYKDVETLQKYLNLHGRILPARRTRLNAASQRRLARAIKRARFMGLLPFVEK